MTKRTSIQVRKRAPLAVELLIEPGDIATLPDVAAEHVRFRQAHRAILTETVRQCVETVQACRADVQAASATVAAAQ